MTLDEFIKYLPSGSGFNCEWEFVKKQKNGSLIFETFFHNMNNDGYYDGYTKIRLKIPRKFKDFSISLMGKKKYTDIYTKDFFSDTIYYSLENIKAFTITDI